MDERNRLSVCGGSICKVLFVGLSTYSRTPVSAHAPVKCLLSALVPIFVVIGNNALTCGFVGLMLLATWEGDRWLVITYTLMRLCVCGVLAECLL